MRKKTRLESVERTVWIASHQKNHSLMQEAAGERSPFIRMPVGVFRGSYGAIVGRCCFFASQEFQSFRFLCFVSSFRFLIIRSTHVVSQPGNTELHVIIFQNIGLGWRVLWQSWQCKGHPSGRFSSDPLLPPHNTSSLEPKTSPKGIEGGLLMRYSETAVASGARSRSFLEAPNFRTA